MMKSRTDNMNWHYEVARRNGAIGRNLIGAGVGGFLMFDTEEDPALERKPLEQHPRLSRKPIAWGSSWFDSYKSGGI